jgi:MFS family permease
MGGLALVAVALNVMPRSTLLWEAALCCVVFGFGMILFFATGQAVVQLGAADEHRGKIMGFWAMMLSGGAPIGNLVFGPSADEWGVVAVIKVQGVLVSAVFVAVILRGWWKRA